MIRLLLWLNRTPLRPGTRLHALLARHARAMRVATFGAALGLYPLFWLLSWSRIAALKLLGRKPAVLFAPTPILNIVEEAALLRRLGYRAETLVYAVYYITDRFDHNLAPLAQNPAISMWLPNLLFLWSLVRFDIFRFFYDGGLWSGMRIVPPARWIELPLLRLAGKRIIAAAYGADVRVRKLNERWQPHNLCRECPEPGKHCVCDAAEAARNVRFHRHWCNVLLAMGDMHDYVFGSRLDFTYWPIDTARVPMVGAEPRPGPVRIVHSPNHRHFKGTKYIEAAVASLRAKGCDVELDIVERVSNDEAKRRYAAADIVVAQCVAGWNGFTEIEGMAAGKPVVSYIRNPRYLAHTRDCPMVSADPDHIEAELERLVRDGPLRAELGRRGRAYVEQFWSFEALADAYRSLHEEVWNENRVCRAVRGGLREFFHGESGYRVGRPLGGSELGEWPVWSDPVLNLARIESGCYGQPPLDADGVPRMCHDGQYVEHPGVVALYALNRFHAHLAAPHEPSHREGFLAAARWLAQRLEVDGRGAARWLYRFPVAGRKLILPWCSCFSQSLGLSILLRARQAFPESPIDADLEAAAIPLRLSVADGGLLWEEDGLVFLEEYPETPPAHVLNGMITGMFGLHELHRATQAEWAGRLFDRCAATLATVLPRYDSPGGMRYDMTSDTLAGRDYGFFTIQQLRALAQITGDRRFDRWARRWRTKLYRQQLRAVGRALLHRKG